MEATNIFIILGLVLEKKDSRYLALPNHNGFGKVAEKREILGKMRENHREKGKNKESENRERQYKQA